MGLSWTGALGRSIDREIKKDAMRLLQIEARAQGDCQGLKRIQLVTPSFRDAVNVFRF